jgi:hypothetical protein
MCSRLASVYERLFKVFREFSTWYLKGKFSRLVDSFNSTFLEEVKKAEAGIMNSISLIELEGQNGGLAIQLNTIETISNVENEIAELKEGMSETVTLLRQLNYSGQPQGRWAGEAMQRVLLAMASGALPALCKLMIR